MRFDLRRIEAHSAPIDLRAWPRILAARHRETPTQAGFGSSRFSNPRKLFRVLYAAEDFPTALAEAVIRDRLVGKQHRYLYRPYLESLVATEIGTTTTLLLLDLAGASAYELGIDSDAKGARAHMAGQAFAEALHSRTAVDGIMFASRLTGKSCVAIFDRAFSKLSATPPVDLMRVTVLADELQRLEIVVRRRPRSR